MKLKFLLFLLFCSHLFSQSSSNYQNKEYVFNCGSNPAPVLSSSNYKITLSSICDGIFQTGLSSSNYKIDSGFIASFPPPEEVLNLRFTSKTNFLWDPEKSVGVYNVYRGNLSSLPSSYGTCFGTVSTNSATDTSTPPTGQGYFYLVTAENRIGEEGTMGFQSNGTRRTNGSPCP